jgi:enamine deaminase RidA (YjgF/YER057c/UK114 family)
MIANKDSPFTPDQRFVNLGVEVPPLARIPPEFSFIAWRRIGSLVYLSGHGPNREKMPPEFDFIGKVGGVITPEQGYQAARLVGLSLLVTLRDAIGSLDRVKQVVEVVGAINAVPEFTGHSRVLNGCTDLLRDIFGDSGCAPRMAVGTGSLPFDMTTEIKMIVEITEDKYTDKA